MSERELDIVDLLTSRRTHRWGDDPTAPSQKLCLVPHEMLCSAIDEIKRLRASRQSILEEAAKERDRLIRAASALKFAPYPAHGSGYVMTVEGDLGEFQAAIRSLHGKAPDKEGEAG